jgi:hypothetical protein
MPSKNNKGKGFLESLDSRERSPADPFPLLGRFAKEITERDVARARVTWPRFKFKFESD